MTVVSSFASTRSLTNMAQIPIVAPILGCITGGFIYDVALYEGKESPANMPNMGLTRMVTSRSGVQKTPSTEAASADSMV